MNAERPGSTYSGSMIVQPCRRRVLAAGAQLIVETDAFHLLFSTDPNVDCTAHITPTRLPDGFRPIIHCFHQYRRCIVA